MMMASRNVASSGALISLAWPLPPGARGPGRWKYLRAPGLLAGVPVFIVAPAVRFPGWAPPRPDARRAALSRGFEFRGPASAPSPHQFLDRCFLLVKYLFEFSVGVGRAGLLISGLGASVRCCVVSLLCSRAWALVPDGCFALGCQFPASLTHPRSGPTQGHPAAFGKRGGQVDGSLVIGSGSRLRGRSGCRCRGVGLT